LKVYEKYSFHIEDFNMATIHEPFLIGRGERDALLLPRMANRHGLIAGATGTGKTVSLRVLTEHFSRLGVPVFLADVKGDLSGLVRPGGDHKKVNERIGMLGLENFAFEGYPVVFWDVYGQQGHPVRTTISEMGPLLLARLLNLNDTQAGILSLIFKIADDSGLLLLDLKDLRSMTQFVGENAREFRMEYGNISPASVGSIQRRLLALEEEGGDVFFGEPALSIQDFMQTDAEGRGVINILCADKLMLSPKIYTTFLLWMLSELFEELPELGDPPKPRMVFFFDEAHLLFEEAPRALLEKIEQVVRLIRSKGVGVYFVTQNPLDLPDDVLGQLGNRVQHALRAFTPRDQRAVRAAAQTFRPNPALDTEQAITQLGVGEALVSCLDEKGAPSVVERCWVCPPHSQLKPLDEAERSQVIKRSVVYGFYEKVEDRESAYEKLRERAEKLAAEEEAAARREAQEKPRRTSRRRSDTVLESFAKSTARSVGSQVGRQLVRGILGSLFGGRGR
jgi:DNA helicase HerA-like ATPase